MTDTIECHCGGTMVFQYRDDDFDWYECITCKNRIGRCRNDKEDFS